MAKPTFTKAEARKIVAVVRKKQKTSTVTASDRARYLGQFGLPPSTSARFK